MMVRGLAALLVLLYGFTIASPCVNGQGAAEAGQSTLPSAPAGTRVEAKPSTQSNSSQNPSSSLPVHIEPTAVYRRPTEREKLRNFAFDAFGPYPVFGALFVAGIQQGYQTPPEWGEGSGAYARRFGSDFGVELITTSTRYVLAEAFREDTLYYRCACSGFFPRFGHALLSTVTARHGEDGRYRFSLAAIGAPYAGTFAATLGWYPSRYEPMDGFRMGNYNLVGAAGENLALEFIYGGPHTLLGRVRILKGRAAGADNP